MCMHVLLLSPIAPTIFPLLLKQIKWSISFSCLSLPYLSASLSHLPQRIREVAADFILAVFDDTQTKEENNSIKRMQPTSSMKEEFLKKWQTGLQIVRPSIDNTSVSERKKAIKLSADVAMASLRKGTTCWSRALIQKTAAEDNFLVRQMLSGIKAETLINKKLPKKTVCHRKIVRRSKKILLRKSRSASEEVAAKAKKLVKRRTQGLRSVVPGGEFMSNDVLLIQETLDYIVSLQTQVNVMRSIVDAAEAGIEW